MRPSLRPRFRRPAFDLGAAEPLSRRCSGCGHPVGGFSAGHIESLCRAQRALPQRAYVPHRRSTQDEMLRLWPTWAPRTSPEQAGRPFDIAPYLRPARWPRTEPEPEA